MALTCAPFATQHPVLRIAIARNRFTWRAIKERDMSERIVVHDPRGYPPKVTGKRLAPRLASLDGKVVYLVDCQFDNSDAFMEQMREWFAEHLPNVQTRIIETKESWVDDPEMRARVEADGDAAILGVGL
jgi:hypothetical protein